MYTTSKFVNLPNSTHGLNNQPALSTNYALGSTNYRKFQHRRIHTEVEEPVSSHAQVSAKYQPYQFQQPVTGPLYKKDYSNTKLDHYNGYGHPNTHNGPVGDNRSSQKPSNNTTQPPHLPASSHKETLAASSKNYKQAVKPSTLATKYLKTEPDVEDTASYRNRNNAANGSRSGTTVYNNKYEIEGVAGKGTFGVVYFGKNLVTGKRVALKKVLQDKKYKNRELEILKEVKHSNILEMRDFFLTTEGSEQFLNVVMDYFSDNLYQIIKKKQMNSLLIKLYTYQVLRGLNYLNMLSIAHRDIKPQNILVDRNTHKVVICDFGSAKRLIKGEPNIAYICSRCYRAPELIFGATQYTCQIDMWSLGCVIVQMINGEAPFLGDSQIDQLLEIIKILGTPQKVDIEEMNPKYDLREYSKFPNIKAMPWAKILKTDDALLVDLVTKILEYSPKRRLTAAEALNHPYFDELKELSQSSEPKDMEYLKKMKIKQLPQLYDFTPEQIVKLGVQSPQKHSKKQKESTKQIDQAEKKPSRAESSLGSQPTKLTHLRNNSDLHTKGQGQDFMIRADEIKIEKSPLNPGSSKLIPRRVPVSGLINSANLGANSVNSGTMGSTQGRNLSNRFQYR